MKVKSNGSFVSPVSVSVKVISKPLPSLNLINLPSGIRTSVSELSLTVNAILAGNAPNVPSCFKKCPDVPAAGTKLPLPVPTKVLISAAVKSSVASVSPVKPKFANVKFLVAIVALASVTCPNVSVVTLKSKSDITVAPVNAPVSMLISSPLCEG